MPLSQHESARGALYGLGVVLQQQSTSSLPPPSLSPGAGVAFLSSPHHSHAGSRRRESTAAPRPEWNAPKFWNLKPWRGYLPEGSLESVSTLKTPAKAFFVWKKQVLVEPAEIFRLHSTPSLLLMVSLSVCVFFFSSPRLLRSRRPWVWRLQPNPSRETRNEEDTALISSYLAVHWCVCAIGVFNVRPGVTTSRTNPRQTEKLRIFWAPNEALAS